jgi:hypothetical protein
MSLGERRRPEVSHGDILTSMIALLCLGKPDFEAIEEFRGDEFFRRALGLASVPSEGTLRQRLDELGCRPDAILREESAAMVARHAPKITPCYGEWVALDIDVSPFDNSGTKKEGLGWTYKNMEGFAPNFAYLAEEGYLLHCELRKGNQHCQEGTPDFLDQAIGYARRISQAKLLKTWTILSSETSARNRWRSGWRRRKRTASGSFRARARRFTRAKRGACRTVKNAARCSR